MQMSFGVSWRWRLEITLVFSFAPVPRGWTDFSRFIGLCRNNNENADSNSERDYTTRLLGGFLVWGNVTPNSMSRLLQLYHACWAISVVTGKSKKKINWRRGLQITSKNDHRDTRTCKWRMIKYQCILRYSFKKDVILIWVNQPFKSAP